MLQFTELEHFTPVKITSHEGENDDEVRDEIRGYLRSFPPEALQEKAMELIQNGREASEVIVSLLQNNVDFDEK
jgi:hypothetical protein